MTNKFGCQCERYDLGTGRFPAVKKVRTSKNLNVIKGLFYLRPLVVFRCMALKSNQIIFLITMEIIETFKYEEILDVYL